MIETSLEAFRSLSDQTPIKQRILQELLKGPGTSVQLAQRLRISTEQAHKRTSDLLKDGLIARANVVRNPTGRPGYALCLTDEGLSQTDCPSL